MEITKIDSPEVIYYGQENDNLAGKLRASGACLVSNNITNYCLLFT